MTVKGIYYVKDVQPAHLRLIGLFTGEERNLPREFCHKISLDNLAQLQFQLQSLQLQKISNSLFRANTFLGPDEAKTWNFLLDRDNRRNEHDVRQIDDPDQAVPQKIVALQNLETLSRTQTVTLVSPIHQPSDLAKVTTQKSEFAKHCTLAEPISYKAFPHRALFLSLRSGTFPCLV